MSSLRTEIQALEAERNRLIAENERVCPHCGQKFKGGRSPHNLMRHCAANHGFILQWSRFVLDYELLGISKSVAESLSLKYGRAETAPLIRAVRRVCEGADSPLTTEIIKLAISDRLDAGPKSRGWVHWDGTWDDERIVRKAQIEARDRNPRLDVIKAQIEGLWMELEGEMRALSKFAELKATPAPQPAAKPKPRPRPSSSSSSKKTKAPKTKKKKTNGSKIPFEELARKTAEENLERLSEVWGKPIPKELALRFLCVMPGKELRELRPFGMTRKFQRELGASAERLGLYLHGRPWSKADGLTLKILRKEAFPALIEELEALVPR